MKRFSIHVGSLFMFLILWIVSGLGIPADASDTRSDNDALRDLAGVYPKIVLNDLIISKGISVQEVESEVRTRLQTAGIRILTLSELRETPGSPILIVEAEGNPMESLSSKRTALYSFITGVSLFQIKSSDKNIAPIGESTWEAQNRGVTFDLKDIRRYLVTLVDEFIRSYRLVNSQN